MVSEEFLVTLLAKNGRSIMFPKKEAIKNLESVLLELLDDSSQLFSFGKVTKKLMSLIDTLQAKSKLNPASIWLLRLKVLEHNQDLFKLIFEHFFKSESDEQLASILINFANEEHSPLSSSGAMASNKSDPQTFPAPLTVSG